MTKRARAALQAAGVAVLRPAFHADLSETWDRTESQSIVDVLCRDGASGRFYQTRALRADAVLGLAGVSEDDPEWRQLYDQLFEYGAPLYLAPAGYEGVGAYMALVLEVDEHGLPAAGDSGSAPVGYSAQEIRLLNCDTGRFCRVYDTEAGARSALKQGDATAAMAAVRVHTKVVALLGTNHDAGERAAT